MSCLSLICALQVPECRLSEDLGALFESQRFYDVTLAVAGKITHFEEENLTFMAFLERMNINTYFDLF